jgi:hypothetical protein
MELEDSNEKFEGKSTRNLKEKNREFFTRDPPLFDSIQR